MLSTKSVLPNFLKSLLIASLTLASAATFAGHHEKGEEAIGELKDMKIEATELKANELTNQLDAGAVEGEMTDKAKEMLDESAEKMKDKAMEVEPN